MPDALKSVNLFFDACNAHDLDAVARCYTEDVIFVTPSGQAEGCDQALSHHAVIWDAFPDESFTILHTIAQGDDVGMAVLITATHTGPLLLAKGEIAEPTGLRVSIRSWWTFSVLEGLIESHQLYWDQLEMYAQLGLTYSPA
ncbi:ester cyclase [Microbispora sp. RL4-1S]|uniref:Ester cyclase n=1 Tax=Microbispora oryzae TaxID=2806554 RepID=A0A941AK78_9ACTN|nr:ester cyclase [Microbispora oryzae]MBP2705807.1 ester cyclase [Microbispora oryzae]